MIKTLVFVGIIASAVLIPVVVLLVAKIVVSKMRD